LVDLVAYRNADALLHVVRAFRDPAVPHPRETVDPARDARLVEDELILADLGVAEKRLERLVKDLKKSNSPELKREQELLLRCKEVLDQGQPLRTITLTGPDVKLLRGFQFLSAKPLLLVLNLDEGDLAAADRAVETLGLEGFLKDAAASSVP